MMTRASLLKSTALLAFLLSLNVSTYAARPTGVYVGPPPSVDGDDYRYRQIGRYTWVPYYGYLPRNAVQGGFESSRPLFLCQAPFRGGVHPGKIVAGNCNITYAGKEYPISNFSVLTSNGAQFRWVWAEGNFIPNNAIAGGFERGYPLYICRAPYNGGMHPGKIVAGNCNIGYGGREVVMHDYQIMTMGGWWRR